MQPRRRDHDTGNLGNPGLSSGAANRSTRASAQFLDDAQDASAAEVIELVPFAHPLPMGVAPRDLTVVLLECEKERSFKFPPGPDVPARLTGDDASVERADAADTENVAGPRCHALFY